MVLVVAGGLKLILGDTRDRYAAWADFGLLEMIYYSLNKSFIINNYK